MRSVKYLLFAVFFVLTPILAWCQDIRIPAEWEEQESVWLSWFGNERRDSVSCRMIAALQPYVNIFLNVESAKMKASALAYMAKYPIDTARIRVNIDPFADYFIRDYVFFTKDKYNKLQVVCFDYSSYGMYPGLMGRPMPEIEKPYGKWDERQAVAMRVPAINSSFVFEGGGIEANGKGTFLIIKQMALQRNPDKSLAEIETELKRTLGARKIIWLEEGLIEDRHFPDFGPFYKNYFGGGANMHIDELARFTDESTVLLPYISKKDRLKSPIDSLNYPMLEKNYKILRKARTADGQKLRIIRIPMPEAELVKYSMPIEERDLKRLAKLGFRKGDTIHRVVAASYCNYFVSNKVVLVQQYWVPGMPESQKQKDAEIMRVLASVFPGRRMIPIHSRTVNRGGGGLHCMTHEVPVFEK